MASTGRTRSRAAGAKRAGARSAGAYTKDQFFGFIVARHGIWHRRFELNEPPPWTEDPVLQKYHFCNIYRELDYGTQWYLDHVVPGAYGTVGLLWRTIIYRLVNNIEVFKAWKDRVPDRDEYAHFLRTLRQKHIVPGTPAHMNLATPHALKSKVDRLEYVLQTLDKDFNDRAPRILGAASLMHVSAELQMLYGVGPFLALQIYRDLLLAKALPFDENDWVEVGPGALLGLRMIYGKDVRRGKQARELVYELTKNQSRWLGPNWEPPISVGDIEHALCEWAKYEKYKRNTGRRRYYRSRR